MTRSDWLKISLLAGVVMAGTGAAPSEGVRQADRWQREADLSRAQGQWDIAYDRYATTAETFPGTPHGKVGADRAAWMKSWGLQPDRSSASDDPISWLTELLDFFTWP